ncbi:hypothetical protein GIB67_032535 [Kingdonia uniflora]|uniref:Pentatricopeptide repeat-containing protein n=1 Tax=Kingdonia uniflora TaxID=39325 RepID=A0A7J7L7M7_9MAGN|nr:hypothetical protein GIB67_032535 [Kingdonia uniflora]
MKEEDWYEFVDDCFTDNVINRRANGKYARSKMHTADTTGKIGCAGKKEKMEKENPGLKVKRTYLFMACHTKADGTFPEPMREKMEVLTTVVQNIPGLVDENFDQNTVSIEMLQLDVEPDVFCVTIGIAVYLFVGTALVDMYAKCGYIERSVKVFEGLFKRNEYSWVAMISRFALHGLANQAICSLERMVKEDSVFSDGVVFLGVLAACTHVGLEEEGTDLLEHMEGSIKGNVVLAKLVAKELLVLEPSSGVGVGKDVTYVQLSNIYVGARRCSDARRVRKMMGERGIKKMPGSSVVEVNEVVNKFVAGDVVFGKDKKGYIRGLGDMSSTELESTLPFRMKLANE